MNDAANGFAAGGAVTLFLNGFNQSVNGLSSNFNTAANAGSATAIVITNAPGGATAHTGSSLLTVGGNNQTATFRGVISDGSSGTISLTKIGTGIQTLGGVNTYTGPTIVNNGALSVTGTLNADGNGNDQYLCDRIGLLYGTGSMGTVTIAAATGAQKAIVNPGATGAGSVGTLTMASATIGAGTDLQFDLQNTTSWRFRPDCFRRKRYFGGPGNDFTQRHAGGRRLYGHSIERNHFRERPDVELSQRHSFDVWFRSHFLESGHQR